VEGVFTWQVAAKEALDHAEASSHPCHPCNPWFLICRVWDRGSSRFDFLSGNLVLAPAAKRAPKRPTIGARMAYNASYGSARMGVPF